MHRTPRVQPTEIKHLIEEAFRRSAEVDASHVSVRADGGTVTLSGKVRTWSERTQAQQTAWSAPGCQPPLRSPRSATWAVREKYFRQHADCNGAEIIASGCTRWPEEAIRPPPNTLSASSYLADNGAFAPGIS